MISRPVKTIGVDLDGVICDWLTAAKENIRQIVPEPERLDTYDLQHHRYPDIHQAFYAEAMRVEMYRDLRPIPDALSVMNNLSQIPDLQMYYVTSRPPVKGMQEVTVDWILEHNFPPWPVYLTTNKAGKCLELGIEMFLEDTPEQAERIVDGSNANVVLLKQKYNQTYQPKSDRIVFATCWADAMFKLLFVKE